jgi:hypothetical protein
MLFLVKTIFSCGQKRDRLLNSRSRGRLPVWENASANQPFKAPPNSETEIPYLHPISVPSFIYFRNTSVAENGIWRRCVRWQPQYPFLKGWTKHLYCCICFVSLPRSTYLMQARHLIFALQCCQWLVNVVIIPDPKWPLAFKLNLGLFIHHLGHDLQHPHPSMVTSIPACRKKW